MNAIENHSYYFQSVVKLILPTQNLYVIGTYLVILVFLGTVHSLVEVHTADPTYEPLKA